MDANVISVSGDSVGVSVDSVVSGDSAVGSDSVEDDVISCIEGLYI